MTAEDRSQEPIETTELGALPSSSRRRLVRGVAGSAGVLLSVHAKTALGGACQSPSAMVSGNTSPRPGSGITCSGGRSPGFWKQPQHSGYWSLIASFPTFRSVVQICSVGLPALSVADIDRPGTEFSAVFGNTPATAAGVTRPAGLAVGLWEIIAFPDNFTGGQLMRHLSAAWLNAGYFTSPAQKYPLTREQIIEMWRQTKDGGTYCPGSIIGSCGAKALSAQQVISYIEGMYDINDGVGPDLCKQQP